MAIPNIINEKCPDFPDCKFVDYFYRIPTTITDNIQIYGNTMLVEVSFSNFFVEKLQTVLSYGLENLIAEVGGYVGLFLGISIVQIIDILDWLGRTLVH